MIKQLKTLTINIFAGANVAIVLLMLAAGYSDRVNPESFPLLSLLGMTFPGFLVINLVFIFFWLTFKWRKVWIPIVGYLLAYPPIALYMPMHSAQEVPDDAIKILSYNVCSYTGIDHYKDSEGFDTIYNFLAKQDADIVCFIHRPEYYKIYSDDKGYDLRGMAEIIIAKHRNGAVGDVLLRFKGEYARFQNPDDDMVIPMPGEEPGVIGSKMNKNSGSIPPPPIESAPNPFGEPVPDGPVPF